MNKLLLSLLGLFVFSLVQEVSAQIVINTTTYTAPNPAQSLVENILLGQGVTVSNVTFTPSASSTIQIGYFEGTNSNLGLSSGIVMSTGNVADIQPGATGIGSPTGGSNADLLTVANSVPGQIGQSFSVSSTNDAAILEFDFVPSSDTIKFRYVFGSDEYLAWVNSSFNDVFAFFISGPGITGPYSGNSKNIAVVPGTALPITISSVNNVLNSQYYIDNPLGTTVSLNGFTKVFTAKSVVTCGETYHLRIAIADGTDQILDSGVFLEANSLSSIGVQFSSSVSIGGSDTIIYEGCGVASIEMSRPGNITNADTIHFVISGSPNNGDYTNFADSLVYLPGQQTAFITFNAYQDNVVEGLDTLILTVLDGPCSSVISSLTLYISDIPPIFANAGNDTTLACAGHPATLHASATGGLPGYHYTWLNGLGSNRIITVNPLVTTTYTVLVEDTCSQVSSYDSITVFVPVVSPILVTASQNIDIVCPNYPATFTSTATGGTPPYTFTWLNPLTVGSTATFTTPVDQTYVVDVTDNCHILHGYDTVMVNLIEFNPLTVFAPEEIKICLGESATILCEAFGGVKEYKYTWTNVVSNLPTFTVAPLTSSIYIINVSDSCGNTTSAAAKVTINYPVANFSYVADPTDDYKILFQNESLNPIQSVWDFADGNLSVDMHPQHLYTDSGTYLVHLIIKDNNQCVDTVANTIWVNPDLRVLIPNAFTPNADGLNDQWEIYGQGMQEMRFVIFDRWGGKIFDNGNSVLNNKWDGNGAPQGVYTYIINAKSFSGKLYNKYGSINLIR